MTMLIAGIIIISVLLIGLNVKPPQFCAINKIAFGVMIVVLLQPFTVSFAQNLRFTPVAHEVLSNAFVRCFFKDSDGFMWLGTGNGLIRYDGTNSQRYEHNPGDNKSLCHNSINVIIEDAHQNLWIGTALGLSIYNRRTDNFDNVDFICANKNHLSHQFITALSFDYEGRLWIGTHGGGINIYNPKTFSFTYINDSIAGRPPLALSYVNSLLLVDNAVWVGTKGGVKVLSAVNAQPVTSRIINNQLPGKQITQMLKDRSGNIRMISVDGDLFEFSKEREHYNLKSTISKRELFSSDQTNILTMCLDETNKLWFGGENLGLTCLDLTTKLVTQFSPEEGNPRKLQSGSIRAVYADNEGVIWVGTFNKGAYLIDKRAKKFESFQRNNTKSDQISSNDIRGFAEDKNGNIWMATDEGLCVLNAEEHRISGCQEINARLPNKHISDIIYDSDGMMWIGTRGNGVYKFNPITGKLVNYKLQSNGFGEGKVFCLYQDKKKIIWAGSNGSGLHFFDTKENRFKLLENEAKPDFIRRTDYISSLLEDSDSTLWVGTYYGLYALRRKDHEQYVYTCYRHKSQPGGISSSAVQTLLEDDKGNLWIGTTDNGVNLLRRGSNTFEWFQKKDGLPSNTVNGILQDTHGNLWISSNMGLSKFDQNGGSVRTYTQDDGLTSNEFYPNATLRDHQGKFFFGGNRGLNVFFPDSIRTNPTKPIVRLTDLKINNQPAIIGSENSPLSKHISVTDDIVLKYDQRSFTIDFVAINYGESSGNHYCYRLEGFETEWNCKDTGNRANYTNIDPGQYTFVVKAVSSDGIWSELPVRLNITIRQAVWKTWWAITFYAFMIGALTAYIIKVRLDRVKMKNQLFLEHLAREKEHELSESKNQFFTNISHEFRTPLSLILLPLESLLSNEESPPGIKNRIYAAYKSADKMMSLVNELMDFDKLENGKLKPIIQHGDLVSFITEICRTFDDVAKKSNINFEIEASQPSLLGWFDRSKLEKIVVNILSNAFKFTLASGEVKVLILNGGVQTEQNKWSNCLKLVILDNGMGMSSEELPYIFDKFYQAKSAFKITNPGTGIGLSLTKGLVELLHGTITAESIPHQTKFSVVLPIDRDAFDEAEIMKTPVDIFSTFGENQRGDIETKTLFSDNQDKPRVLIAEDNNELRQYLAAEFREEFIVLEAKDGQEGIEMALDRDPDLIISDILMPHKNGIEFCHLIKTDLKTSHIPFILLTARTTVEDQIQGVEIGADVYITKPFSLRFLLTHARQIIDSRQKLYSHFSNDVYLLPSKIATNEIDKAFLQKLIDHIVDNMQNTQLGVDSVAAVFNLSRTQVYRKIKALSGKTVVEFIRMVRLKQALKLMEKKQQTLSEIAYQTGFNTASYFTRAFKEQYGKTPSEFLEKSGSSLSNPNA